MVFALVMSCNFCHDSKQDTSLMQILANWSIQVGKQSFSILKLQGFSKERISVVANGLILSGSIFLIVCMGC